MTITSSLKKKYSVSTTSWVKENVGGNSFQQAWTYDRFQEDYEKVKTVFEYVQNNFIRLSQVKIN